MYPYQHITPVYKGDPVYDMLEKQDAHFFLAKGEYEDESLRVQAKIPTMFWLYEQDGIYQYVKATYEMAERAVEAYPDYSLQDALNILMYEPFINIDYDALVDILNRNNAKTFEDMVFDAIKTFY